MKSWQKHLCCLATLLFGPILSASLPASEQWLEIGTDSRGTKWSVQILRSGPEGPHPAQFSGDVTVGIPSDPKVGEPRIWTVDAKDRVWVFSENGHGFNYDIRSRKLIRVSIPVRQQVSAALTVQGDKLWFQEFDPEVGSTVSSWSPGDAAVKHVFAAPRSMSIESYVVSPSTLWVAATAHGTKYPILRAAVDPISGKIVARFEATVSDDVAAGSASHMVTDGDVLWITHPTAGRIDRLTRSGLQRAWTIGKYAPAALVVSGGRAVVIGQQGSWHDVGPTGPNQAQWSIASSRVFVLVPNRTEAPESAEIPAPLRGATLSLGSDGVVRLGSARVRIDGATPRIEVP